MTIAGILMALLGAVTSATAPTVNGQWLVGAILVIAGFALIIWDRKGGPRDRPKGEER